jgi:integral membrane protein (TIGR01906 family)
VQSTRWFASALFVLCVPIFLLLTNVRVAAMEPRVYEYSFATYDVPEVTGVDRAQLDAAARDIVTYFADERPLLTTQVTIDREPQPLFTPREALHMRDVKALFRKAFVLHEITFAYFVAYIAAVFLWSHERSLLRLASQCILAGAVTAGVLTVAALVSVVGFDALFRGFHLLSFANDFWELDPTRDHLIQMFPRDFWFTVTLAVGAATIAEGALLAFAGLGLRAWLRRTPSVPRLEATPAPFDRI